MNVQCPAPGPPLLFTVYTTIMCPTMNVEKPSAVQHEVAVADQEKASINSGADTGTALEVEVFAERKLDLRTILGLLVCELRVRRPRR